MLIIGNNLWIYLTVLLGNIVGTYWASTIQKPDKHSHIGDLEAMLLSKNPKVLVILKQLSKRMQEISKERQKKRIEFWLLNPQTTKYEIHREDT